MLHFSTRNLLFYGVGEVVTSGQRNAASVCVMPYANVKIINEVTALSKELSFPYYYCIRSNFIIISESATIIYSFLSWFIK